MTGQEEARLYNRTRGIHCLSSFKDIWMSSLAEARPLHGEDRAEGRAENV